MIQRRAAKIDNDNRKLYIYVCTTTYQPNPKFNPNLTTKQHGIVNIQLNIVIRIQRNLDETVLVHRMCEFRL